MQSRLAGSPHRSCSAACKLCEMQYAHDCSPLMHPGRHGEGSVTTAALGRFDCEQERGPGAGSVADARAPSTFRVSSETPSTSAVSSEQALENSISMVHVALDAVPLDAEGKLTSIGSIKHEAGLCEPCLFFLSGLGCSVSSASSWCRYGILCEFCHVKYDRRHRRKMCQRKRESFKRAQDEHQALQMKNDQNDASLAFEAGDGCTLSQPQRRPCDSPDWQGGYILLSF